MAPAASSGAVPRRRATDATPTSSVRRAAPASSLPSSPRDATRGRGRETPRERVGTSHSEPALKSPRDARDGARAAAAAAAPAPPLPPSPAIGVLQRHTAAELTAPPLEVLPQI